MKLVTLFLAAIAILPTCFSTPLPRLPDVDEAANLTSAQPGLFERDVVTSTVEVYLDKTSAYHQGRFDALHNTHRIITISVHGDRSDPRYSVTWAKRSGPAWEARHGLDKNGLDAFYSEFIGQRKYTPTLVGATGPADNPVFAIVMEKLDPPPAYWHKYYMRAGADSIANTLASENKLNHDYNRYLKSVAIYGDAQNRRYAGIWFGDDPIFRKWKSRGDDPIGNYQTTFDEEVTKPLWHPSAISLDGNLVHTSVWTDTNVGRWGARHGLSAADMETEIRTATGNGLLPIALSGGGSGSRTRFAAVFADTEVPRARAWTATGPMDPALAAAEAKLKTFMQNNAVRTAQLAVSKNGAVRLARAYTWAESGFKISQPSDRFLLASNSKMFLAAAVQWFYDNQPTRLSPTTKVYPLLGLSSPLDSRADDITIQQLLDHQSGYNHGASGFDANYAMRTIAIDQGLTSRITSLDVAKYMYKKRRLDYTPGMTACPSDNPFCRYENYGYVLGSAVIEKLSGTTFISFLRDHILTPEGISEVMVYPTLGPAGRPGSNEVVQEDQDTGLDSLNPSSPKRIANIYGGGGTVYEASNGADGLAASARGLVQFIWRHAAWGNGPRSAGSARSGSTYGASTFAQSLWGGSGVDFAVVLNTRNFPAGRGISMGSGVICLRRLGLLPCK